MRARMTAAAAAAMVTGIGIGAAMAPVSAGQSKVRVRPAQVVQLLGGSGYIGVSVRDVDAEEAKRANLPAPAGVLIEDVRTDSPAEKAGFREGDIVVEFDGERVRSTRQFTRVVQETPVGREVQAVVVRDGQRTTLSVEPAEPEGHDAFRYLFDRDDWSGVAPHPPVPPAPPTPPTPPARPAPAPPAPHVFEMFPQFEGFFGSSGRLGISVDSLSDQLADYFGTEAGVLVTSVTAGSAAEQAGVKAGDVIVAINGDPVDRPSELSRRTLRLEDGEEFTLDVVRNKQKQTLKGKVEARQPRRWTARTII